MTGETKPFINIYIVNDIKCAAVNSCNNAVRSVPDSSVNYIIMFDLTRVLFVSTEVFWASY